MLQKLKTSLKKNTFNCDKTTRILNSAGFERNKFLNLKKGT